jgi:electron transport complex protein RnfG
MAFEILKPAAALLAVTLIVTAFIGFSNWATTEPIAQMRAQTERDTVRRLMPDAETTVVLDLAAYGIIEKKMACHDADGNMIGYAIIAAPVGYGGPIEIMVAFSPEGAVLNSEVLRHKETPGLCDNAVKHPFLTQFIGKSGSFGTDGIDTVTSATVTSMAIAEGIRAACAYIEGFIRGLNP